MIIAQILKKAEPTPIANEDGGALKELEEVSTPKTTTIKEVSEFLGVESNRMVKTLIYTYDDKKYLQSSYVETMMLMNLS